ncbi:glycosyltransferase family 2 protein [Cellulomonas sp. 179-A 4D5 NHS]|uniref:glycosyltransferase family 2 protein n=1 Tax=Cellulomonas sp. 179-A 4D5 NHS TaxID=3142378 RepID=UPI00399F3408
MSRRTSVVMLAYGDEPYLHSAVASVLASSGVELELVLVDNGCTSDAVATLPEHPGLRVLRPGRNLGFTGGVNLGAREARYESLTLVNSDAVVEPETLSRLLDRLAEPGTGIAGALVLLADEPGTINSAGNPLHLLGLSWAGSMGRPASSQTTVHEVASASGACLSIDRELWDDLGGFPDAYFAYLEDLELSWRAWQHGRRVVVVPDAVVHHHYEFSRSPLKMYLVERNRLLFLLTVHQRRTLLVLAVPLLAFEAAITAVAVSQGWGRQKLRGWRWLAGNLRWVRERRRVVQATRTVPDRELVRLLTDRFDPVQLPMPAAAAPLERVLQGYWRLVRRHL